MSRDPLTQKSDGSVEGHASQGSGKVGFAPCGQPRAGIKPGPSDTPEPNLPVAWRYRSIFNEHSWTYTDEEPIFNNDQYIKEPLCRATPIPDTSAEEKTK